MTSTAPATGWTTVAPSISVVMPLYNKAAFVIEAIQSALAQGPVVGEVLVVDDGSTDDGPAMVFALQQGEPRVKLFRQPNSGVSCARNVGIANATGSHIAFLDADDLYLPGYITAILGLIREFPGAGMYATGFQRVTSIPVDLASLAQQAQEPAVYVRKFFEHWRDSAFFCTCSVCIPAAVFATTNFRFPVGEALGEDQDVWFRLAERYPLAYCRSRLVLYRTNVSNSLTEQVTGTTVLPCYERLAARADGSDYPLEHRRAARKLAAAHFINVARARAAAGDRSGALQLLAASRSRKAPIYWLRTMAWVSLRRHAAETVGA